MNLSFLPWRKPTHPVPVVIQTFKVKKTDLERLRDAKHRQLAAELGMQWPPKAGKAVR